jgi:protein O-GlcNAc transferase
MTVETLLPPLVSEPLADPARLAADGMGLLARNEFDAARAVIRRALALGDRSPSTVLNLALAEDGLGGHARAQQLMRQAAADCPDWDEPLLRLAGSLRSRGAVTEAEALYRQTLELNARRTEALTALGGLLLNRGEALEARDLLLRCCGIDPDRAETWDALGLALAATGEPSAGLSAMVEAQRLAPTAIDYALNGVGAAIAAGEQEAEQARLELCCLTTPLNPVGYTALGVMRERRGDRSGAIDALETAAALAPGAALPVLLLGGTLARANRLSEAERTLARATALDPANPGPRNDRAAVLMRMHRHAEARALLADLLA